MAVKRNPSEPADDGRVKMPRVDAAMNKVAPTPEGVEDDDERKPTQAKKDKEDDAEILARMRKRFDRCIAAERDNRSEALDDKKFAGGEQWPATTKATREAEKRPMLTINKLPTFVHQVTNDQRQNRPSIRVSPVGDKTEREAAKIYRGWIRCVERDSAADLAYDTAFQDAVIGGWGYFRIVSEYEAEDSFDQVLRIKRVRNLFTVYLDPDRLEPDGADAKYGFVTDMLPRTEFEDKYPDADPMPWTANGLGDPPKNWVDKDNVRVAEYYEIAKEIRTLVGLSNGHVGWKDALDPSVKDDIAAGRLEVVKEREAEVCKQTYYIATATQILERQPWPGKYVPIIEVCGDELDIEGKVKKFGVVRHAKDPQRMYNYWSTAETELIALAPKAPYIMEEGQAEGHESQWKTANQRSHPYLLYKGTSIAGKPAPPPQRQQFAGVPAGVVQAKQGAAQDMMATTGIRFDATMHERMQDESGRAIRELRRSGDLGSFHLVDNLARALKHAGEILIDLAPHYLDTKRYATVLDEDDSEDVVLIDPHAPKSYEERKGQDGKTQKVFNPKLGRYSVTVDTGPSYATKRIEAAESMMAFAKAMPNVAALIADLIAKNQDWPGADEMARRLAKAVPAQLMTPDQKDIPPQVQALIQALDQQVKQLSQERQQLMSALNDKSADRAVAQDKVNKDFEAKLLAILQKSEDAVQSHLDKVADQVLKVHEIHTNSAAAAVKAAAPGDTGSPTAKKAGSRKKPNA